MKKNKYIKSLLKIVVLSSCGQGNLNKYENLGKEEELNKINAEIEKNEKIRNENKENMDKIEEKMKEYLDKLQKNQNLIIQKLAENNIEIMRNPNTDTKTFGKRVENLKKMGCMAEYQAQKLIDLKEEHEKSKAQYEESKENLSSLYKKQFEEEQKKEENIEKKYEEKKIDEIDTEKIGLYFQIEKELKEKKNQLEKMRSEIDELERKYNGLSYNLSEDEKKELLKKKENLEMLEEEIQCIELILKEIERSVDIN